MSLHAVDLSSRLKGFLARREIPRRFASVDKDKALGDEIRALEACLQRNAPRSEIHAWWPAFEAALGEQCPIFYPTEKDIRDVAKACNPSPAPQHRAAEAGDVDDLRILGQRLRSGEPVGDKCLYGKVADKLLEGGHCSFTDIDRYRRSAFHARKALYGEEAALRWREELEGGTLRGPVDPVHGGIIKHMPMSALDQMEAAPRKTGGEREMSAAELDQLMRSRAANPIVRAARSAMLEEEADADAWRSEVETQEGE